MADERVTIPCPGWVESLNAAVAGSLLLYEASARQRRRVEALHVPLIANARLNEAREDAREETALSFSIHRRSLRPAQTKQTPLAERMRPRTLDGVCRASSICWARASRCGWRSSATTRASMIFWGPPGVGKTTLAKIIAQRTQASFIEFSAVLSGIKEIKQVMVEAEKAAQFGSRTILFIDEIHRFNKAQQDAFLPYVERGTIRLIGATTENP